MMSAVWKRPSLTAIEVLWRWVVGIPTLAVCAWAALRIHHAVRINMAALHAMTVFKPVDAAATMGAAVRQLLPVVAPVLLWLVPLVFVLRAAAAAVGRAALLRRLDPQMRPRRWVLFVLSMLRAAAVLLAVAVWVEGARWAAGYAITGSARRGAEPNVVLLCALVVFGTMGLFAVWASSAWVLDTSLVLAGARGGGVGRSLYGAVRLGPARAKLVEINLVMGIVKVELIVLAMVLSSCPLPFESVESTTFLAWWWAGVIVLYLVMSDYFHAVRMAAYLAMYRALELPQETKTAS
jgi:hypothetical protein